MMQHSKRSQQFRQMGYEFLKTIVNTFCAGPGLKLRVLILRANGQHSWRDMLLTGPETDLLWDQGFLQGSLQFAWVSDYNDLNKPWVSSNVARPHLADWIAFCLDKPARLQKMNKVLYQSKTLLASSALGVVSELAAALDSRIMDLTVRLSAYKQMTRKTDALTRWTLVGAATELLFKQDDLLRKI